MAAKASLLLAASSALILAAPQAWAQAQPPQSQPQPPMQPQVSDHAVKEVVITAHRLDAARDAIQPDTGASTYSMPDTVIQQLPGGQNASFNQVVLQMPGVAQDSDGQLHVRGEHGDLQYRFNGVILPEGLSGFGQVLSPRVAQSIELMTGALPAEYGLRTAGVIDIRTKTGMANSGEIGIYGGSHGEWEPSFEYGGSNDKDSYFVSGSYMQNQLGIESVDGSSTPHHDRTEQVQAFGYWDHILNDQSRVSVFAGAADQKFQIPDPVGLQPSSGFQLNGRTAFPSQDLNENQHETNDFAAVSYLFTNEDFTGQVSLLGRYTSLDYFPDATGELLYNGFAQRASKADASVGFQAEGVYHLGDHHTLRGGFVFENDHSTSATTSEAFETFIPGPGLEPAPVVQPGGDNLPLSIVDNGAATAQTYSLYAQDEWKLRDDLVLNYGLRFDQYDSFRNENQLSPRVSVVWTPIDGLTVHAGYARYFTPPPFELVASQTLAKFANTVAAPQITTDTSPYAERDDYFDVGVQDKVNRHLTLGVDTYAKNAKNMLDEGQFGAPIILTPFNYRVGQIRGAEFTSSYTRGNFSSYFNLAYTNARGKDIVSSQFNFVPDELTYIANNFIYLDHNQFWSSSFGAAYKWRETRFSLDGLYGSGLRASTATVPNGRALAPYTVVNLSVIQHFTLPGAGAFDARFDVVNLFDKLYEIRNGTGVGVGAPQWGARRGLFVGLTKLF
jgi:outer membrane receptor protein involved in Fe transport